MNGILLAGLEIYVIYIVDLESHEVMFVDRSGEGCVGFYQMYTLDELIEKGKQMLSQ